MGGGGDVLEGGGTSRAIIFLVRLRWLRLVFRHQSVSRIDLHEVSVKALVCPLSFALMFGNIATAQKGKLPVTPVSPPSTKDAVGSTVAPAPNTLLDGTPIKLRLTENLSSETAKTGESVPFEVTEEVDVMGRPVILKGAQALATVTNAQRKKNMGRGGTLDVHVDSVRLVDGEKAQLTATQNNKGGGHVGAMTGAIVATSIVFFPAAPLFLFVHGKPVLIPKGTEITAFVQGDMRLDMAKMVVPGDVPAMAAQSVVASTASLSVDSSVPGADIAVDGHFVGSTPSTVAVVAGEHTITVTKKGYADWSRSMDVAGSAVRLNADMEAKP